MSLTEDVWFVSMAPVAQLMPKPAQGAGTGAACMRLQQSAAGQRRHQVRGQRVLTCKLVADGPDAATLASVAESCRHGAEMANRKGESRVGYRFVAEPERDRRTERVTTFR